MDKMAETAIRSVGTNAIPAFLQMMATKESPLRIKVTRVVPNQLLGVLQIRGLHNTVVIFTGIRALEHMD
jgi:hypothetical protein